MYTEVLNEVFCRPVFLAAMGGIAINLLNLVELGNVPKERRPDLKDFFYWLPFGVWPLLGGFVAYVHNEPAHQLGNLLAFQIGVSCPLILRSMSNVIPSNMRQPLPPDA